MTNPNNDFYHLLDKINSYSILFLRLKVYVNKLTTGSRTINKIANTVEVDSPTNNRAKIQTKNDKLS